MAIEQRLSLPQAVERLFGIPPARHEALRNAVNTLVKAMSTAKLLNLVEEEISLAPGGRKRWTLLPDELTCLNNAILLHGVFGEPKTVIRIFSQPAERRQHAKWARSLLLDRQSVAALGLIRPELVRWLDLLDSEADLKQERLPNPFGDVLPQVGLGDYGGNLLKILATQTAALSTGDSMMVHYLNGELERAYEVACAVETDSPLLSQYRDLVLAEYQAAKEFDDLLDEWR